MKIDNVRLKIIIILLFFVLSIAVLLSYKNTSRIVQHQPSQFLSVSETASSKMIVSTAASLSDALEAIQLLYRQKQPEIKLIYNFGSSGSLQQQIEQGAPVDVFISAAPQQMNDLDKKGLLLQGSRKNLLTNEMVLIVPKGHQVITKFEDLMIHSIRKIAIGEPESVPAGKYAKEVLTSLNMFNPLQSKMVYAKNVRQVLSYVETGNVDAGIVYQTDAKISSKVDTVVTAPTGSHSPIIYPIAVIKDSKKPEIAKDFVTFVSSNVAKAVFENLGFGLAN